jgi:hypothetical protein
MSQTHPRARAHDFERPWRSRFNKPLPWAISELQVVITHRFPRPHRYGWELRPATGLSVPESQVQFASWEKASQAGKLALKQAAKF